MAKTLAELQIGDYEVTVDGTTLGYTLDGSTFSYDPQYVDLKVDDYGQTPVDKALSAENVTIKVRLTQNGLDTMANAFPQGTLTGSDRLDVGSKAGDTVRDNTVELVLAPRISGAGENVTVWKAYVSGKVELNYKVDEQLVYEVEFTAFPDTTKAAGKQLFVIGDTTT